MISQDPPRHDRFKALVIKEFTPEAARRHDGADHGQIIDRVLDSVADRERFDLVADVARPIPARVIGSMLGTPPEDDATLVHWTNVFTAFEDPAIREAVDRHPSNRGARSSTYMNAENGQASHGARARRLDHRLDECRGGRREAQRAGTRDVLHLADVCRQ